jgi:FkbM family methyltransferase
LYLAKVGLHVARYPFNHQEAFKESMSLVLAQQSGGVLHLGAHTGQEARTYNHSRLKVIWIEAIPSIFDILQSNIASFQNQRAICAIVGDKNGAKVDFHISSNDAVSSSVFALDSAAGDESFQMSGIFSGAMSRIDSLISEEEMSSLGHWVVDLQGAELLALKGAGELIRYCNSLYIEVSTRTIYEGGVQWGELQSFLVSKGFFQLWDPRENSHENVIFIRKFTHRI